MISYNIPKSCVLTEVNFEKYIVSNNQDMSLEDACNRYHILRIREKELEQELNTIQSEIDLLVNQFPSSLSEERMNYIR